MADNGAPLTESRSGRKWTDPDTLRTAAYAVGIVAASWWLLGQLAVVLRPLLLAAFLGYVLLPYYSRLRSRLPAPIAIGLLAGTTAAVLAGLALAVYASLLGLSEELPRLKARSVELVSSVTEFADRQTRWVTGGLGEIGMGEPPPAESADVSPRPKPARRQQEYLADQAADVVRSAVNSAAGALLEAAAVGLYLLFLLLGAEKLPGRVRAAYPPARAENILHVAGRINSAIVSYLKAKLKSSLLLALPVWIVLAVFGVKFSFLWAVLTFLCNFIPYVGSVVAYALPVAFAFLQLDLGYKPVTVAVLVLVCHVLMATVAEPMIIGRAVGLSPLVILAALSLWGLLWGLPGMFLAVPLTVVLKIVFEHLDATRPVARLLSGE